MKKDHTEKEENKDQKEQKEKKESFFKRHKKPIIFLIILAAAIAALSIFLIIRHKNKEAQNTEQTAKVERRNIVNSVSGTGKIISQNSNDASVPADFGLVVESVDVAVGDVVGEGQVLCKLDASSYENEIKDLNSQIASLEKDKKTRHDNYNQNKQNMENLQNSGSVVTEEEVLLAQQLYTDTQTILNEKQEQLKNYLSQDGASETDENAVKLAQDIASIQADLEVRKNDYDAKQAAFNAVGGTEQNLSSLSEDSLSSYDTSVNAAINTIQKQVNSLQERVDAATITAKSAGTVTEINVTQGQTYLGGTAVMVEDTDHFYVEATVSEYDIPDVQKGMKAVVKTDATRDDELTGTVTFVSPKADASQNSLFDMNSMLSNSSFSSLSSLTSTSSSDNATFSITITLDDENDRLRLGMNASVSIVTDQSENTLSVPYEAVYTDENGSNYVFLQKTKKDENGKKLNYSEKVPVTKGLEGNYYTEIISDKIKEGDTVILPDGDSDNSVNELLNMMGSDAGL